MVPSTYALTAELRDLDHALAEVEFLAERRAFDGAAKRFHEFHRRLREHLEREQSQGRPNAEHAQLEVAIEAVASSLQQGDYGDFCYGVTALGKLLAAHQRAEEHAAS
jgi:hypothetical protein